METLLDRRDFFKITGLCALGALCTWTLDGCASSGQSSASSDSSTESSPASSSNSSSGSSAAQAGDTPEAGSLAAAAVVCFSATGNTLARAEELAAKLGLSVDQIIPAQPYSSDDLNYSVNDCRANRECNDASSRPEIGSARFDLSGVDTLYIGYPIWWGDAAPIMRTYIESVSLEGKKVVPFCTSGGSGISGSVSSLQALASAGNWTGGLRISGSEGELDELLAQ